MHQGTPEAADGTERGGRCRREGGRAAPSQEEVYGFRAKAIDADVPSVDYWYRGRRTRMGSDDTRLHNKYGHYVSDG